MRMFRCESEKCRQLVLPGQPENHIVTERRETVYETKILKKISAKGQDGQGGRKTRRKRKYKDTGKIKVTKGWEIAKEIRVCPECYQHLTGQTPKIMEQESKKPEFKKRPRFNEEPTKRRYRKEGASRKKPVVEVIKPLGQKKNERTR
jgi:hypothetical protein